MIDFSRPAGEVNHSSEVLVRLPREGTEQAEVHEEVQMRDYRTAIWRVWDPSKPIILYISLITCRALNEKTSQPSRGMQRMEHFTRRTDMYGGLGGFINMGLMDCTTARIQDCTRATMVDNNYLVSELSRELMSLMVLSCFEVVAGWGNHGSKIFFAPYNNGAVRQSIANSWPKNKRLLCLGVNAAGQPRFPGHCKGSSKFSEYWSGDPTRVSEAPHLRGWGKREQWF